MAGKREKPEDIVLKLLQVEVLHCQGKSVQEAVRQIGVTVQTYYRWCKEYGGMNRDQLKRLKELEVENQRLRRAVSDLTLWEASGRVIENVLNRALDARERRNEAPPVLQSLLPKRQEEGVEVQDAAKDVIFILGSRPHDDDFILWLGPKLEARGYSVLLDVYAGRRARRFFSISLP